jgi:hypothetical protein
MSSEIIAGIEVAADALSSKLAELRAEEAKAARTVAEQLVKEADARVARMTAAIELKPVPASVQSLVSALPIKVKPRSKRGQRRAGR